MAKRPPRTRGMDLNQPLSDQPWWVKTVVWVGVPTAAFGILLWFVLRIISTQMDTVIATQSKQEKSLAELTGHLEQETEQSWVIQGTLSRICINTARTDADRLACVSVGRRPQ